MKFGIKTAPQHTSWEKMLDVWRAADEIELFESAWNFDHFYPLVGDLDGPCMEAWVTLAALARETSRIRVGCMVNGTPYRHPAVLANMAASETPAAMLTKEKIEGATRAPVRDWKDGWERVSW